MLGLLIEQQSPLDESLVVAAEASGNSDLKTAAEALAEEIRRGGAGESIVRRLEQFPPMLAWLLANTSQQPAPLAVALRSTADSYRRQALRLDTWLRWYLPMAVTVLIAGTAVVLFALSIFVPWFGMLRQATFAP